MAGAGRGLGGLVLLRGPAPSSSAWLPGPWSVEGKLCWDPRSDHRGHEGGGGWTWLRGLGSDEDVLCPRHT